MMSNYYEHRKPLDYHVNKYLNIDTISQIHEELGSWTQAVTNFLYNIRPSTTYEMVILGGRLSGKRLPLDLAKYSKKWATRMDKYSDRFVGFKVRYLTGFNTLARFEINSTVTTYITSAYGGSFVRQTTLVP
jgi:hypothetical protein